MDFLHPLLLIFTLRVADISLYTLRFLMVMRGRKFLSWIFSFVKSLIFILTLKLVLSDMGDWQKMLAYSIGFATGLVLGMWIEERLAIGYSHLRVISSRKGAALAINLREEGHAVTEISAQGQHGTVTLLNLNVLRRKANEVVRIISGNDPEAFITIENVRSAQKGFFRK